jgi:chromosome segregation ATPase
MKLTLPHYIILALTALVVFLLLTRPTGVTEDNSKEIALTRQIDSLQRSYTGLLAELAKGKVEFKESKKSADLTISVLTKKLSTKKVKIDTLIIENPALKEYVETAENLIQEQGNRIDALEGMYGRLEQRAGQLQANFEANLKSHQEREKLKDDRITALEKKLKKKTFGNKVLKVGLVIGTIGGILIGLNAN